MAFESLMYEAAVKKDKKDSKKDKKGHDIKTEDSTPPPPYDHSQHGIPSHHKKDPSTK